MKALLVLLLASGCAFGQTKTNDPLYGWALEANGIKLNGVGDKPLKCGKWEHPVAGTRTCPVSARMHTDAEVEKDCPWTQIIACAPIMHEVTEKEWQALMERLKKLENVNKSENIQMLDMWVSPEAKDSDYSIVRDSSGKRLTYGQLRKMGKDLQAGRVAGKE